MKNHFDLSLAKIKKTKLIRSKFEKNSYNHCDLSLAKVAKNCNLSHLFLVFLIYRWENAKKSSRFIASKSLEKLQPSQFIANQRLLNYLHLLQGNASKNRKNLQLRKLKLKKIPRNLKLWFQHGIFNLRFWHRIFDTSFSIIIWIRLQENKNLFIKYILKS